MPALGLAALLAGCGDRSATDAPPRLAASPPAATRTSVARIPISARLADLEALANRSVPATLWTIDRDEPKCVPAQRATLCIKKDGKCVFGLDHAKITPDIACHISGEVSRGPVRLGGNGDTLLLAIPVAARFNARDTGEVLKGETATGKADIAARVRLGMAPDWQPQGKLALDYAWREAPGIDFLGQRITFTGAADRKLPGLLAKLERELPGRLAELGVRNAIAKGWASGFTVLDVNHKNPPVWIRVTPRRLGFLGYRIADGVVTLDLAAEATTETFVGPRPADPAPTPLPPAGTALAAPGLNLALPVVGDWHILEAVLAKALGKLSVKGIEVPTYGRIHPKFGPPTLYATTGNRVALGLPIRAEAGGIGATAEGKVWLTARAGNAENSPVVTFSDLQVTAAPDADTGLRALIALVQAPAMQTALAAALTQDFSGDLAKLRGKLVVALADKPLGDLRLRVTLGDMRHGKVLPLGQGLFLPAEVTGTATLRYAPR
ncbi:hypothetical protein IP88_02500 [alpha proteobacterium AAP81b]|nr:hypothetical protein IP88_02500 [alpha proteobacterium AAP81b]